MESNVYAVPIFNKWLLYAPLRRITALVNSRAVLSLKNGSSQTESIKVKPLYNILQKAEVPPAPRSGNIDPEFLGIIPTRDCDMSCLYCGFGAWKTSCHNLDISKAVMAVDWMAQHLSKSARTVLEIHFFGGEPMMVPDVVEAVVHRARWRAIETGLTTRFEVATNGFFNQRQCTFLTDYFDSVVLSCDGPEEVHNRHRPAKDGSATFNTIFQNARALSLSDVELCIRMCVTQDTVNNLEGITRWFCDNIHPSIICFEPLQPTERSNQYGLSPPDPWDFSIAYVNAAKTALSLGVIPVYDAAAIENIRFSFCPVGLDTMIITPDDRISACYLLEEEWQKRGLDLNFGRIDSTEGLVVDQMALERIRQLTHHRGRCLHCFVRWHCAGGCHVNQSYDGCTDSYNDFCIRTRIIAACRLLEMNGMPQEVTKLLQNRDALERLVLRPSDCLADWDERCE